MIKTPIREIVFSVSFIENLNHETLDKFVTSSRVSSKFTVIQRGLEADINLRVNEKPTANFNNNGYVLKIGSSGDRILQAKKGGLSFHKILGYEKYEVLLNEFLEFWKELSNNSEKLTVSEISIRYINAFKRENEETISDLININIENPYTNHFNGFFNFKFNYPDNNLIKVNVIVADNIANNINEVILDLMFNKSFINGETEFDTFINSFNEFHIIKNEIYNKSVTAVALNKFN